MLIGAAAAYLLTNESVQRTAIKSVVKVWSVLQGGVEEIKERFQDAEAEIRAAEAGHQD
jgi:translation initiation factor 2 alpha subunit (eIF-2alpha)